MEKRVLLTIFIVAFCGILYELLIATFASYVLGDGVTQFSITIGLFIGAMGAGSYCSKYVQKNLNQVFVKVQFILALIGGLSILVFSTLMWHTSIIAPILYFYLIIIGFLIGLELPLLSRLLENEVTLKDILSHSLSLDNVGALVASILFPLFLIPLLGMFKTALLVGILNALAGILMSHGFKNKSLKVSGFLIIVVLLVTGFVKQEHDKNLEADFYKDPVVFSKRSSYQKIVITKYLDTIRLYLDGQLQFNSFDEHRYHESIVHSSFLFAQEIENVLILGGGDGLAIREILKYPEVKKITLVELDPAITELAKNHSELLEVNKDSLNSEKVTIINEDAFRFLQESKEAYDVIISDLPDPNNLSLTKLYSKEFFNLARTKLKQSGVFITQATSPQVAKKTYWSIFKTIKSLGVETKGLHLNVPSFGEWGFILFSPNEMHVKRSHPSHLSFFSIEQLKSMLAWPKDLVLELKNISINTLLEPNLYDTYKSEVHKAGFL